MLIDLHCHILPGLDDGSRDLQSSILMAQVAEKEGITRICATPHFIEGSLETTAYDMVLGQTAKLNEILTQSNVNVEILPGSEIFLSPGIPKLLQLGRIPSLNNTRYLLVELPMHSIPRYTEEVLYELQILGKTPVLAHPERNIEVMDNPELLRRYMEKGILLQVNTGSLLGTFGKSVTGTAWKLLQNRMASLVATDAHNMRSRAPMMRKAHRAVLDKLGLEEANRLFRLTPWSILQNEDIPYIEPVYSQKKERGLGKVFSGIKGLFVGR